MWPLSSRRSSTFSMSKLGYLASRAPDAMFSKSRKTAMVASDVRVVITGQFTLFLAALELEPVVIEADADAFGVDAVRHHFMPQPAFEEHQLACGGGECSPRAGLALGGGLARRRGHEAIQPRILEFDPGSARRDMYIVGAAQRRQRMQMQAVHHVFGHDVEPAIRHFQFASLEIPLHRIGESLDVPLQLALQGLEGRRYAL